MTTLLCPFCGEVLSPEARFCKRCGQQLLKVAAVTAAPITVFLSYSHADTAFVRQLAADLAACGIHAWIDHESLKPGTPDWEESVRRAIRKAQAIVLVASPASRQSRYVRDELRIASLHQCTVYPVWAAGAVWIDSVPFGYGATQYIDARGDAYAAGLQRLVNALVSPPDPPSVTFERVPPCPACHLSAFPPTPTHFPQSSARIYVCCSPVSWLSY